MNVRSDTSWSVLQRGHTYGTILGNGRAVDRAEGSAFGRAGQTLRLDYAFTPSNGSVSLGVWTTLTALDSNYWRTFEAPEQGRVEVPIPRTGFYTIRVSFWGFNGRYDVAWAVVSGLDVSTEAV
ncbi:MAG TPA: hypothetical protein VFJ03_01125 [Candidatus Limnocylindria bacterium]|nr:hypothetical protein [Candidatus Limnocylindria bacterium]